MKKDVFQFTKILMILLFSVGIIVGVVLLYSGLAGFVDFRFFEEESSIDNFLRLKLILIPTIIIFISFIGLIVSVIKYIFYILEKK